MRTAGTEQFGRIKVSTKGFMGKDWDGGDVAYRPETWAALAAHLHPGAFLMAFAGTRGYHRMACAIEDAGLIIHPAVGWLFGSGFPKATRLDTQIDAAAGVEQTVVGEGHSGPALKMAGENPRPWHEEHAARGGAYDVTAAVSPLAQAWQGHRYGLQAMKPAFEFICVAQKPYSGKPVDCITSTGAGALNIDGGRLEATDSDYARNCSGDRGHADNREREMEFGMGCGSASDLGRWPANFAMVHHPECNGQCHPECPAARLDAQTGTLTSGANPERRNSDKFRSIYQTFEGQECRPARGADTGGASRFFYRADWNAEVMERLETADPVLYEAKTSRVERDGGLHDFDKRRGACEQFDSRWKEETGELRLPTARNNHPTVKPIALTRWLATLLLPPDSYAPRRLLVPFSGSGSEMIGATQAGWEVVTGIEQDAEYCAIAEARLQFWQSRRQMELF